MASKTIRGPTELFIKQIKIKVPCRHVETVSMTNGSVYNVVPSVETFFASLSTSLWLISVAVHFSAALINRISPQQSE